MRISDWSSDVCSSDLGGNPLRRLRVRPAPDHARCRRDPPDPGGHRGDREGCGGPRPAQHPVRARLRRADRKSAVWGKSVYVSLDLGGHRIIKKKKLETTTYTQRICMYINQADN